MTSDPNPQSSGTGHSGTDFQIRLGDTEQFAQLVTLHDPKPTGRQIIAESGRRPEKDFQLFLLAKDGELKEIDLEDTVDLRDPRVEEFFVFRSDRVFYFVIDDRRFPWGAEAIAESSLKYLAKVPDYYSVWLEQPGGQSPLLIAPGTKAELTGKGVEVFRTGVEFKIKIDREFFVVRTDQLTGAQLRKLPTPPLGPELDLFEVVPGSSDRKIADGDVVEIRNGLRFFSAPGQINPGMRLGACRATFN